MKTFSKSISLTKNSRGIYSIDTIMGCESGMKYGKNGCYDDCYSAKSARLYGYDFSRIVRRDFDNIKHYKQIIREINSIEMPFVRIGSSGDPSEDWEHTLKIVFKLQDGLRQNQIDIFGEIKKEKEIVIITKHFNTIPENLLNKLSKYNICINTSISAIDNEHELNKRLDEYKRLSKYCKSVLRLVSFDFNLENETGKYYNDIQEYIYNNYDVLDTVFRPSKSNVLVKNKIINIKKSKFLGKNVIISKRNKKTYFGKCSTCLEMCGINSLQKVIR